MDQVNRNRLEEFRQLRKEVRHSEEYLIVGIDIAKDRHYAFFGTATGKTLLKRMVFSNDHEGFIRQRGDVGVNGNYLSHPSNSVISSGLAIRFTDAVVISGNRPTGAPVHPNFRTVSLVLAWPQFTPLFTPCQVLCLFLFLFAPTPHFFS